MPTGDGRRAERVAWIERVAAEAGEGCREWPWGLNSKGYAIVKWDKRQQRVGHVTLALSGRPRPSPEMFMLHSCDNPVCAAPWHLRWGTVNDNWADCISRDRARVGERNHLARLTAADVRAIRAIEGRTQKDIAAEFGVSKWQVGKIRNGKTWTHLLKPT